MWESSRAFASKAVYAEKEGRKRRVHTLGDGGEFSAWSGGHDWVLDVLRPSRSFGLWG